jgi:hypothetical protein
MVDHGQQEYVSTHRNTRAHSETCVQTQHNGRHGLSKRYPQGTAWCHDYEELGLRKHGCQMSATHSTYSSPIAALTKTLIATSTSVMMCLARRTAANDPSLHGSADR